MFIGLILKGIVIGIAFIIPGLSGGTLAMYLGVYEKLLHAIGNIFKEFRKSVKFLLPVFIGIAIAVVGLAKLLGFLIDKNSLIVLMFFMGLVIGGTKDIYNRAHEHEKGRNLSTYLAFFISFAIIILMIVFSKIQNSSGLDYFQINAGTIILIFALGMAASSTMIVPGVSGSALLVVLGYYTAIVTNVAGELLNPDQLTYNLKVIVPFAIGAGVGIIVFSRLIEYLLKHFHRQTYYAILGFIIASVIAIFFEIRDPSTGASIEKQTPIFKDLFNFLGDHPWSLVFGIMMFVIGFFVTKFMTKLEMKTK